ncbi:MAG: thioredoxin domain-containing protein [Campylobacterota bacterium]|nr:thioredoxin domain-containing protein [Campylobacterota bacterium]
MANLLQYEDSPYLQQHKDNPLDWYPWGDEAFQKAEREDKPIFISIGYSSCHWCHVMEHEVFENEEVAAFMNEHFVSIKVDREERPDIDKYYQEVHMLLNRRPGGWPTSIFSTPQNKPIFAATYLPVESKNQSMGFSELTRIISEKISENDPKLYENADEIEGFLKHHTHPKEATHLKFEISNTFIKQCSDNFEKSFGGFSVEPKFPHTSTLNSLMNLFLLTGNDDAKDMAVKTLTSMQRGGIYDIIDGGFCRYSVDREWLVPHFEKMTYDNGLLCELYVKAFHSFGNETLKRTAIEIAEFMLEFMSENAQFYSASDADTEGEEGKYFIYNYDETLKLLTQNGFTQKESETILIKLNISPNGNFEGSSIARVEDNSRPVWFSKVQKLLKERRTKRIYPFIDKKVQTSWNAMMIKALFALSSIDASYKEIAVKHLNALLEIMLIDNRLYHSTLIHKTPKIEAFLEDYAYLGVTLIAAYENTYDEHYLIKAQKMANAALERYYDKGMWYFSRDEFETKADISDSSYPGSVGVIVDLLLSLGSLLDEKYRHFAFKTLEYYSYDLARKPINSPYLFNQMIRYIKEDRIIKSNLHVGFLHYPYALKKFDPQSDGYMICGLQSCFATTSNISEIDTLIYNSF